MCFQHDRGILGTILEYTMICVGLKLSVATAAKYAFDAISTCEDALQSNDIGALYSASCRSLFESVQASCPNVSSGQYK